jgi:hypothetical protein
LEGTVANVSHLAMFTSSVLITHTGLHNFLRILIGTFIYYSEFQNKQQLLIACFASTNYIFCWNYSYLVSCIQ